jgi:hypothetical protein
MAIYRAEFTSDKGNEYVIDITTTFTRTQPGSGSVTDTFSVGEGGFELDYHKGKGLFEPLFPSSVSFEYLANNSTEYNNTITILSGNKNSYYVIIYKNESVHWWGFLQAETMSVNYEYYPQAIMFEAFDLLSLCGQQSFFGYDFKSNWTVANTRYWWSLYGLGERINNDPTIDSQHPSTASWTFGGYLYGQVFHPLNTGKTLLGMFYSLIHDAASDELGVQEMHVSNWDRLDSGQTQGSSRFLESWYMYPVEGWLYGDLTEWPNKENAHDNTIYSMLKDLSSTFRTRIFQRDGYYHIIQNECYEGLPGTGNMVIHEYTNAQSGLYPQGGKTDRFPFYDTSRSLSESDFVVDLTAPRTNPDLLAGASIKYTPPINKAVLDIWRDNTEEVDKYTINSSTVTASGYARPNNYTNASDRKDQTSINVPLYDLYNNTSFRNFERYDQGQAAFVNETLESAFLHSHFQYNNGIRKMLSGTLYGDYEFFKAVDFNGDRFLCISMNQVAKLDEYKCEWAELNNSASEVGEIALEE